MDVFFAKLRTEPDVNRNGQQQQGNDAFQERGIRLLHKKRAGQRAEEREQPRTTNLLKTQRPGACEVKRRAGGTEGGLQFVRAERDDRVGTKIQQHRQGEESAAARNRVIALGTNKLQST